MWDTFSPLGRGGCQITLSTGIGGGLLTEVGLYRGADSFACELGHHTIGSGGPACLCGSNGCLERMCSGLWLERDYGRPAQELFKDPEFVSRYVIQLAQGIKSCLMFLNPARIIIGGVSVRPRIGSSFPCARNWVAR